MKDGATVICTRRSFDHHDVREVVASNIVAKALDVFRQRLDRDHPTACQCERDSHEPDVCAYVNDGCLACHMLEHRAEFGVFERSVAGQRTIDDFIPEDGDAPASRHVSLELA